jgi:hypothetical protein
MKNNEKNRNKGILRFLEDPEFLIELCNAFDGHIVISYHNYVLETQSDSPEKCAQNVDKTCNQISLVLSFF